MGPRLRVTEELAPVGPPTEPPLLVKSCEVPVTLSSTEQRLTAAG